MTRPVLSRLAACLAAGLTVIGLVSLTGGGATAAEADTPLAVSIRSLAPSTIPAHGRVTVTGQITNQSDTTWTDLKVYMLTSSEPLTTGDQLEEAASTDPATEVGGRLFKNGLYDEVGDLAPGASTSYTLTIPRRQLQISGAPGAYWLGVHVLGASDDGRDSIADGRARTFIPLMRNRGPSTSMSLVVPLKSDVERQADGRLDDLSAWQEHLGPDGRLGRLLQFTGTSGAVPLTWVVDPAVLDAARSVAEDNPTMDTGPTDTDNKSDVPPSPNVSPSAPPSDGTDAAPKERSEEARAAASWLSTFARQSGRHTVLSAPYGDADVASLLRGDFTKIYRQATDLSATTMDTFGIDADPVVAPPTGYLPNRALANIGPTTLLILGDRAAPGARGPVVDALGHRIVLTDTSAGEGGPGPTPRSLALAERQRILSEAAVHALSGSRNQPLVVSTPQQWDPGSDWREADFFGGLEVPWLRMVNVPTVAAGSPARSYDGRLTYPRSQRRSELPLANPLATQELSHVGGVFADLLTRNDTVDGFLSKSAMLASSYSAREHQRAAAGRARDATEEVRSRLRQVTIDGPPFVTMSSEEGTLQVTVVNGLDEPVTVGIKAETGSTDLAIHTPGTVSVGGGQRASVRLRATSNDIGVHSVTLLPTSPGGNPLGAVTKFNVRSSQVGFVIWIIMGLGAAVLVAASGTRIVRRVRGRRAATNAVVEERPR